MLLQGLHDQLLVRVEDYHQNNNAAPTVLLIHPLTLEFIDVTSIDLPIMESVEVPPFRVGGLLILVSQN